ncbi:MAG TPA: secretin N-terminal domain-containing protein [Vicinamibacteria bacterium]|nr:secretin N-terminal domain-containing protein [Vicinamibacteria bacterium]
MRHVLLPLASVLLLAAAGCATSSAFRAGESAERLQDYDRAVLEYQKAVRESPGNVEYHQALDRARLRAATDHVNMARRLSGRGLYNEALNEYRIVLDLTPDAPGVADEVKDVEARRRKSASSLQEAKAHARERALAGLDLPPEAQQPLGLVFRGASLREAYLALGRAAGVNITFDPSFQDSSISLDLRDVGFEQALNALDAAGRTFHRVVDSKVLNVVPDTATKRREFEQQVVKTLFLSNADLKETIDLLRVVLGARRVAPVPGANALTINDTPDKVAAAERIVEVVDKRRAEVAVDVRILEVSRNTLKEYGIYITSGLDAQGIEGVAAGVFPNPGKSLDQGPYDRANLVVSSLPGAVLRMLESDSTTRLLANPQLRVSEGQTAQARFGDQVPVPVTTFNAIATGGIAQQPITSFEYKNVGVNIDITPRAHHDGEVSLLLKLEISAVGAAGYQGLPTFNNRTVNSTIRLRDGETNMLAGLILDNERHALTGLPGIANIPLLGRLFAKNHDEGQQTDIVMTLTPHVIRRAEISEEDLRSFLVGGEVSPFVFETPPATSAAPAPSRPTEPRIEPIRPPSGTPPPPSNP